MRLSEYKLNLFLFFLKTCYLTLPVELPSGPPGVPQVGPGVRCPTRGRSVIALPWRGRQVGRTSPGGLQGQKDTAARGRPSGISVKALRYISLEIQYMY